MSKVDSRHNAFSVIAKPFRAEAIHKSKVDSSDTKKDYFASAKFVDRHAANAARDDSKPPQVKKWILTILMTETRRHFSQSLHIFSSFSLF